MKDDFDGTLAKVAAIGYREVEFAGYFGRDPNDVNRSLEHAGLVAPSAHFRLQLFRRQVAGRSGVRPGDRPPLWGLSLDRREDPAAARDLAPGSASV